jgi:hypothetical protein
MFETDTAAEDSTAALAVGGMQSVPWRLIELSVLPGYRLFQRFADGTEGVTELRELIFSDHAGVFATLRDPDVFSQVSIDPNFGSVLWANGLDIAPDATHEDILRYGLQVLR